MRKLFALLALPLVLAVAACDTPPSDGSAVGTDDGMTTTAPAEPAVEPVDPAATPMNQ